MLLWNINSISTDIRLTVYQYSKDTFVNTKPRKLSSVTFSSATSDTPIKSGRHGDEANVDS